MKNLNFELKSNLYQILFCVLLLCPLTAFSQNDTIKIIRNYENGQIKETGNYIKSNKIGIWTYYYPTSTINAKEYFVNDQLDGKRESWYKNGQYMSIENYTLGVLADSAFYFFEDGRLQKKGIYLNGLYEGKWVFFHSNGVLSRIGYYEKGNPEGRWVFYDELGLPIQEGNYLHGKENGNWKFYNEGGILQSEGEYAKGAKVGKWNYYSKKGKLIKSRNEG